jgi:hypothetical protein
MTMHTFLGELLDCGFVLERLVEPGTAESARRVDEARYLKTLPRVEAGTRWSPPPPGSGWLRCR